MFLVALFIGAVLVADWALDKGRGIRFEKVIPSGDGQVRVQVAFDAAENDYKRKLGFRQEGEWLVNNKCGTAVRLEEVNLGTSGCRPAPLAHRLDGQTLVMREDDVIAGWRFFR